MCLAGGERDVVLGRWNVSLVARMRLSQGRGAGGHAGASLSNGHDRPVTEPPGC